MSTSERTKGRVQDERLRQLRDGRLSEMARWYRPDLLGRVAVRTLVSSVFGQYADQRLMQAASDSREADDLRKRYDFSNARAEASQDKIHVDDKTGACWVDYIADVGDGFESTYTMAYLLAQDELVTKEVPHPLRHGDILIMGGDQCYPQATREEYKKRLQTPYEWAFDVKQPSRKLFAIPGNHDWYDGLVAFDGLFCAARDNLSGGLGTVIGGWQSTQHRSYWALKLPHDWWIWGADIQFQGTLDVAQVNYFKTIARSMSGADKVVLCLPQPNWLMEDLTGDEDDSFVQIASIVRGKGATIHAVIAGDWHHYSHYRADTDDVAMHFITSGGGGAFLHPTHGLREKISVRLPEQPASPFEEADVASKGPAETLQTRTVDARAKAVGMPAPPSNDDPPAAGAGGQTATPATRVGEVIQEAIEPLRRAAGRPPNGPRLQPTAPKIYPDRSTSWWLGFGNLLFPFKNYGFAMMIGTLYWLITWQFHSVVKQNGISSGKIDAIELNFTTWWGLMKLMPIYVINTTLSIGFSAMVLAMFFLLCWYVDAVKQPRWRRLLVKGVVGSLHTFAHLAVMLGLFLGFLAFNNWLAPKVQVLFEDLQVRKERNVGWIPNVVIEESLKPLSTRNYEQRVQQRTPRRREGGDIDQWGETGPRQFQTPRSAAPPSGATRGAAPAPPKGDSRATVPPPAPTVERAARNIDERGVREVVGLLYPFQMIFIGGILGGMVWGFYWVSTGVLGRMHTQDAFAALRIQSYKNFLRMRIEPDRLTIYPIGVDSIPPRSAWRARAADETLAGNPSLVPTKPIAYRLIEQPIEIWAGGETSPLPGPGGGVG